MEHVIFAGELRITYCDESNLLAIRKDNDVLCSWEERQVSYIFNEIEKLKNIHSSALLK